MPIQPLYLLADSQLLFSRSPGHLLGEKISAEIDTKSAKAAYIGASNGDQPEFYGLFTAAMDGMGISNCRMVPVKPSPQDIAFLESADLILLAGGSDEAGWNVFEQNGLKDFITRKRLDGVTIIGISAGAVQLGLGSLSNSAQPKQLQMFRFAPFYVGAHAEENDWWDLRALVNLSQLDVRAIGIPTGGGAIYHADGTLEPMRKPLFELLKQDGKISEHIITPLE
jgi:hypothetical protein